ncbi:hypothetical protein GJ496_007573 [Pomphorhynchus laevis]|nr:hypothetical protein GJ496_007573 [Pomphorhynchus laevis]
MTVVLGKLYNPSSDVLNENCTLQTRSNLVRSINSEHNRAIPEERAEHIAGRSITDTWFSNFDMAINRAYTEVISWSSNVYHLPKCIASKYFFDILASLYSLCTLESSKIKCTFMLIGVYCQIILQKTHRPNSATIRKNREAKILQHDHRFRAKYVAPRSGWVPSFCNLMSFGKTRAAMRLLANPDNISPVMSLDQEIGGQTVKYKLKELHPRGDSLKYIAVLRHPLRKAVSMTMTNLPQLKMQNCDTPANAFDNTGRHNGHRGRDKFLVACPINVSPGPAIYKMPDTLGCEKGDVRMRKAPCFTMGSTHNRSEAHRQGPGAIYNLDKLYNNGKERPIAHSFGVALPLPGAKKSDVNYYGLPDNRVTERRAPAYTFGGKGDQTEKWHSPGPIYLPKLPPGGRHFTMGMRTNPCTNVLITRND